MIATLDIACRRSSGSESIAACAESSKSSTSREPSCAGAEYDPAVQRYVLTELDSGERVDLRAARARALGRDRLLDRRRLARRDGRQGRRLALHRAPALQGLGAATRAQEIAEIFDGLGGELNAATSREHTVVYARVPDDHLETALDVMGDMVFAPRFAELDSEREVVLEEIAMYEDTPQELVHDLISEAVFGDASARAAGDRHAPR